MLLAIGLLATVSGLVAQYFFGTNRSTLIIGPGDFGGPHPRGREC
jgi:hypothetical protein